MTDNVIKVSVTSSKSQRVSVSSSQQATNITANSDTGRFWSQTSKNWAVSGNIVDNEDYSSKYYANKSKESANTAKGYLESTREIHNNFASDASSYINELTELKETGTQEINTAVASSKDEINAAVAGGKDEINSTKTTILQDIEFVADGEKKEIEDLIDNGKEELKESIGDVKVLTTLEIGDIGFTQMAIDEALGKRRILNGQLIIQEQYVQFTNIIKNSVALNPSLACTESEWQTTVTMSTNGVCEKFVIDDSAGTIRLPKYPTYLDLTNNAAAKSLGVSVYGNGMTLGITNGTGYYGVKVTSGSNQLNHSDNIYGQPVGSTTTGGSASGGNRSMGLTRDASKSGITGSVTIPAVTSEKIKGTYFIQVATGAETEDNIINEIELNNPFSLLDYKYSEYELNNLSWLRSNGQWNAKAVYPAVYDLLLKIYNGTETKAGVSVKLSTASYTDTDFVLNTAEATFRLPIKVKLASGKAVVGNGLALGVTGVNGEGVLNGYLSGLGVTTAQGNQGVSVGTKINTGTDLGDGTIGITTNATKSGIETSNSGLFLYFYVGETVQNANLINAGRIEEIVATRTDKVQASLASMASDKYTELAIGGSGATYTAPANGYFCINGKDNANTNTYAFVLRNQTRYFGTTGYSTGETAAWCNGVLPAKKGDVVYLFYRGNVSASSHVFRFYYAEGEQ